jgi:hypothetical protein
MESTTIKLRKSTKSRLDKVRRAEESYDDAIQRLLELQYTEEDLILGYKNAGRHAEWDAADAQWPK